MKSYGNKYFFKKKVSLESKKNLENIKSINYELIHRIFDAVNVSLLLICVLSFLSFDSQKNGQLLMKYYLLQNLTTIILLIIFLKLRNFI